MVESPDTYVYNAPAGVPVTMSRGTDPGCVLCAPGSCSGKCDVSSDELRLSENTGKQGT